GRRLYRCTKETSMHNRSPLASRRSFMALAATAAVTLSAFGGVQSASAASGDWPNKPIRMIVNFPPGGAADVMARMIGQPVSEALGQPVVVENRAGANGNIGAEAVVQSEAD